MVTKHNLTDAEWLEKFESGDIEFDLSRSMSLIDLMDVRAFELLRREVADALLNTVRLARQNGRTWAVIARDLGVAESEASQVYGERIGAVAEAEGKRLEPGSDEPTSIGFSVRHLRAVEQRLRQVIEQTAASGDGRADFIDNYLSRSDDDARMRWNLLD